MAGESPDTQEFGASDTLHHASGTDVTRITSAQNAMLGAFGILIFAFINYPFLPTSLAVEYKTVRLLFEGVILLTLALAQANSGGRTFVAVLLAIGLYLVNYAV